MDETPNGSEVEKGGWGGTIAITLVVVLMALGGIYFFYTQQQKIEAIKTSQSQG